MTLKPILFNTEMMRKILSGEKTVTRRVVNPLPPEGARLEYSSKYGEALDYATGTLPMPGERIAYKAPYKPGDILYVREAWGFDKNNWIYKADFSDTDLQKIKSITRWHPSIHMPKEAARIFLRVTDVRVERLQEITDKGARAEGCGDPDVIYYNGWLRCEFAELWGSTIKPEKRDTYGWLVNPWVWVIEFERCEKPKEE